METSFMNKKPDKGIGLAISPDVLASELLYVSEKRGEAAGGAGSAAAATTNRSCCSIDAICYSQDSNSDDAGDEEPVVAVSLSPTVGAVGGACRLAAEFEQQCAVHTHPEQPQPAEAKPNEMGEQLATANQLKKPPSNHCAKEKANALLTTSATSATATTRIASAPRVEIANSPPGIRLHPSTQDSLTKPVITTMSPPPQEAQHPQQQRQQQQQQHEQPTTPLSHRHPPRNTNNNNSTTTTTTAGNAAAAAAAKPWQQQYPFLKSQSLDIVGNEQQTTLIYQMHHNVLVQLTEDHQQEETRPDSHQTSSGDEPPNEPTPQNEHHPKPSHEPKTAKPLCHKPPLASAASTANCHEANTKIPILESRPIYPNIPYSPYASPRSNRRRPPLRESRRISIEKSGSFLQLNQYKLMDQIGQGSYGLVKLAYSEEDSTHYAMKILSKRRLLRQAGLMKRGPKKQSLSPLDRVYREIAVLKKLDHPNVVKLIEVLDDPVEDSLYMVFEWVQKGEVLSIPTSEPLSEARALSVFRDTLLGLEYLHYQRIVHADLKPSNLLLTDGDNVKIADLGVCNEFLGEDAKMSNGSTAGTPAFRAPETLQLGQYVYCGKAADIWALGVTLYALVFGVVPFPVTTVPLLYEHIKRDPITFPERPKICDSLKDCICRMLDKDPLQRITLPELKEHPWVTSNGSAPLPSEEENCRLVQIDDDDINSVVRSIPKLDTLILIKTMLKNHSFGNPFMKGASRAGQRTRLERFVRAGRSNSAPGAYTNPLDRQYSTDTLLPSLCESSSCAANEDS